MLSLRWWVLLAAAALVVSLALLSLRQLQRRQAGQPPPPASAVAEDAGAACPDALLVPARPLAGADTAEVLLLGPAEVRFFVDGVATLGGLDDPARLAAGERRLRVEAPGAQPAELVLQVVPFEPAAVEARVDGAAVTVFLSAVRCASCARAVTTIDLKRDPALHNATALDDASRALSGGDWKEAAMALRSATAAELRSPRALRQVAVLLALAGLTQQAAEAVGRLPRTQRRDLDVALAEPGARRPAERLAAGAMAVQRWNLLSERVLKVSRALGGEAPSLLDDASRQFDDLSAAISAATRSSDLIEQEAVVNTAVEALQALVRRLRALHPGDCAWQSRVTAATTS